MPVPKTDHRAAAPHRPKGQDVAPERQVLLIGAGALGCATGFALGAAGITSITVMDDDKVELTNLPRQTLYAKSDVGEPKVEAFAERLRERYPSLDIQTLASRFTTETGPSQLRRHCVVVDGSDNLTTKFLANDLAVENGVPLVHGAAVGLMGQILSVPAGGRPCYRCLFEEEPRKTAVRGCPVRKPGSLDLYLVSLAPCKRARPSVSFQTKALALWDSCTASTPPLVSSAAFASARIQLVGPAVRPKRRPSPKFQPAAMIQPDTTYLKGLKCLACGTSYPTSVAHVCELDFGPLDVDLDTARIAKALAPEKVRQELREGHRPNNMWRYQELLPLSRPPTTGFEVGMTPLLPAPRLGAALGIENLFLKDEGASFPTLSFKDRVVTMAIEAARGFDMKVVGCASTGNLANATAALAAKAGLPAVVVVPSTVEAAKVVGTSVYGASVVAVDGTYDQVNRLCSEIADKYGWGFVNINLRVFYTEGAKTVGYEILEQLGFQAPANLISPLAGGSLVMKLRKSFQEFAKGGAHRGAPEDPVLWHASGRVRPHCLNGRGRPRCRQAGPHP